MTKEAFMYLIDKNAELTPLILGKILNRFQTVELPKLVKSYKYYKGEQAITLKKPTDTGKPANKIITNLNNLLKNRYYFNILSCSKLFF